MAAPARFQLWSSLVLSTVGEMFSSDTDRVCAMVLTAGGQVWAPLPGVSCVPLGVECSEVVAETAAGHSFHNRPFWVNRGFGSLKAFVGH